MHTLPLYISLITLISLLFIFRKNSSSDRVATKLLFGFVLILLIWALSGYFLYFIDDRGTFGDMFGATNSLFSALAFGGLIYTALLQNKDLKLQHEELKLTRQELRGQKETLQAHNEQIELQNFEGTFFQLLQSHNTLLESIDIDRNTTTYVGRDAIKFLWQLGLTRHYDNAKQRDYQPTAKRPFSYELHKEILAKTNLSFSASFGPEVFHYFRSLYNIFKLIDNASVKDKKIYTNIVRAQLSTYELLLIFYNCAARPSSKFTPLIEEYALFKHIDMTQLIDHEDKNLFKSSAYGGE